MFTHLTAKGRFYIAPHNDRWHAFFEDEDLGSYHSPQSALDDLAGGHTFSASCGDTSILGIPDEIGEWERVPARWPPRI